MVSGIRNYATTRVNLAGHDCVCGFLRVCHMCSQYFVDKGTDAMEAFFWKNALSVYRYVATENHKGSFSQHDKQSPRLEW